MIRLLGALILWVVAGLFLVDRLGPRVSRRGKRWEEIGLTLAAGPFVWLIMVFLWVAFRFRE
jgi:hypothetical protein